MIVKYKNLNTFIKFDLKKKDITYFKLLNIFGFFSNKTFTISGSTTSDVDEDFPTDYPDGPDPTPVGQCALPPQPRRDTSVKPGDGVRFGNTPFSRQEFTKPSSFMNSILDESTFALEFKSSLESGLIFYVAGSNHIDFVGLIMLSGKVGFEYCIGII